MRVRKRKYGPGVPPPQERKPFRDVSRFLKETFGAKSYKVCVDGGFTCPNRDGTCGIGGCIFCGERGSGEFITEIGIRNQILTAMEKARVKHRAEKFLVYFQNFTNTYAPVDVLRAKYDSALADGDERIVGLAVGTRADCISEEIADLLAEYAEKYYVQVEIGLQTSDDETAKRINRGYPASRFTEAVQLLRKRRLNVVAHILPGLPGETKEHLIRTVDFLNQHDIQGLKIHSLYVLAGTRLAELYRAGEFEPITMAEYIDWAVYVLRHVSPQLVIHRLSGDCAREKLVAPEWILKKKEIHDQIIGTMEVNGWKQGDLHPGTTCGDSAKVNTEGTDR